jgi:hypothetical protein
MKLGKKYGLEIPVVVAGPYVTAPIERRPGNYFEGSIARSN